MLKECTNQPIHKQTRKKITLDMKNNLLNKALRIVLGIVSILPQKKSKPTKSNTNSKEQLDFKVPSLKGRGSKCRIGPPEAPIWSK